MVSMLPDMMLVAAGMAMAFKMRGEQRVAMTWFGDGSTSRGDFHEAMNWAGVQKLPVIFILENNQYAYSTPVDQQFAVNPIERAAAYGFPGESVDGNDPEAMFEATRKARERALAGEGPTLIEAVTMRMHGHAAHDDMKYVPKEQVEEWRAKDPIDRQVRRVEALGVDVQALRDEVKAEIDAAVEEALQMPMPDPGHGDRPAVRRRAGAARGRQGALVGLRQGGLTMPTMTYLQAISDAMREEMRADERVFVMGEDIGVFGGAFKVTDGFIDEFGPMRVMDTPLAESGIVGTAIGAAVEGMRPIAEMQFADFISCGFDQLVNVAGKMYYRQGLSVNITVRLPSGGGFSGGPFHSQNPEAWFMHSPGLKVVAPSTAEDAKGLLIKSMRDPNPVVYMEHKHLYRRVKGDVPGRHLRDAVHRPRGARGHRPRGHHLRRDGPHRARGDRGPRRRLGRGARPALARAARRGGDPRLGAQVLEGGDRRRGQHDVRGGRAGRRRDRREGLGGPRRAGRPRRDAGRADPVLAHAGAGRAAAGRRREGGVP